MEERIPTKLWVSAHIRRCDSEGVPAVVVRRGDPHSGMVIVRVNLLEGASRVLVQMRGADGKLGWLPAMGGKTAPDAEVDTYIRRQTERDPDLWVIELEDRLDRHWLDGAIL